MANIVIRDLEMDKELDKISLLDIMGGGCRRRRKYCYRRTVAVYRTVRRRHVKIRVWYTKHRKLVGYKSTTVCFWR